MKYLVSRLILEPRTRAYFLLAVTTILCLTISICHTNLAMHTLAVEVDTDNSTAKLGYVEHTLSKEVEDLSRTTLKLATDDDLSHAAEQPISKVIRTNTTAIAEITGAAIVDKDGKVQSAIRDDLVGKIDICIDPIHQSGVAIINHKLFVVAMARIADSDRNVMTDNYLLLLRESVLNYQKSVTIIPPTGEIPENMSSVIRQNGDVVHGHLRLCGLGGRNIAEVKTTVKTPLWVSVSPQKYLIMIVNATLFALTLFLSYITLASVRSSPPRAVDISNRLVQFVGHSN